MKIGISLHILLEQELLSKESKPVDPKLHQAVAEIEKVLGKADFIELADGTLFLKITSEQLKLMIKKFMK